MSDFTAAYSAAPRGILLLMSQRVSWTARRRPWTTCIAVGMLGLGLIASIFGEHAPDPNRCDPGASALFAFTQTASPQTFTLGCPPGVKYTVR